MVLAGWRAKSGLCEYISLPVLASIIMALRADNLLRKDLSEILTSLTGLLLMFEALSRRTGVLAPACRYEAIICWRTAEREFVVGENLWSEVRIVESEEITVLFAD